MSAAFDEAVNALAHLLGSANRHDSAVEAVNAIIEATLERLMSPPPKKHEAFADVRLDAFALAALCAARSHDDAFANRIAVREVVRCIKRVLDARPHSCT